MRRTNSQSLSAVLRAITLTSIVIATPAFADDNVATTPAAPSAPATPAAPAATGEKPAAPVVATAAPTAEPAAPAVATDAGAKPEEPPASRYPRAVIARPLTLPSGLAMLGADATANHDFSAMGGAPIVGYGFTDDFEVQVPYSFATKDFEAKGSVAIDAGYKLLRGAAGGKLEVIARARGGYNTLDSVATPVQLGVHAQYNFTDTLAIISGYAGTQQISIAVADDADMKKPVSLGLPVALGFQATPELYLQVDTKLAQINLHDSENLLIGKDITPASLTVVYNVINALDVQAAIATDLSNSPGDALSFLVGARYYAGQL